MRWLLRARLWLRHPPARRQVWIFVAVLALCLVLVTIERAVGWPAWLTPQRGIGPRPFTSP